MDLFVYINDNEVYEMLKNYVNVFFLLNLMEDGVKVRNVMVILFDDMVFCFKGFEYYIRFVVEIINMCFFFIFLLYIMVQYIVFLGFFDIMFFDDERWYDLILEDGGVSLVVYFFCIWIELIYLMVGDYIMIGGKFFFRVFCIFQMMLRIFWFVWELEVDVYKITGKELYLCRFLNDIEF